MRLDCGEVSTEDILAAHMAARADDKGIIFVAFTATPKDKTMELFGTRPDSSKAAGPDNLPGPFHVYSMRQAIEKGFVLDVLQNYTSYKLAFKLAHVVGDHGCHSPRGKLTSGYEVDALCPTSLMNRCHTDITDWPTKGYIHQAIDSLERIHLAKRMVERTRGSRHESQVGGNSLP